MDFSQLPSPDTYDYELPEQRIAFKPLDKRDASRLLVYNQGYISHQNFSDLPGLLPENGRLFFNETKIGRAHV